MEIWYMNNYQLEEIHFGNHGKKKLSSRRELFFLGLKVLIFLRMIYEIFYSGEI
jgi:hypothetical protein